MKDANGSPVSEANVPFTPASLPSDGKAVSVCLKFISPCGYGTWKNGKWNGRNSAPNFSECVPFVNDMFSMKSHSLLYSFVGSQSLAPIWLYVWFVLVGN